MELSVKRRAVPEEDGGDPVLLHVYDLVNSRVNYYLGFVGCGLYHTGVQVGPYEYLFSSEGVFKCTPYMGGFGTFRETIPMGMFYGSIDELAGIIRQLREKFAAGTYNIVTQNCNHFSDALCDALIGERIPAWPNHAATGFTHTLSLMSCTCSPEEDVEDSVYIETESNVSVDSPKHIQATAESPRRAIERHQLLKAVDA